MLHDCAECSFHLQSESVIDVALSTIAETKDDVTDKLNRPDIPPIQSNSCPGAAELQSELKDTGKTKISSSSAF